jgi:hypothetical protein
MHVLAGLVARMREQRNACKVWIRKPERNRLEDTDVWEDDVMDLKRFE